MMEKNNYPQVYLEECKYKIKKKKISRFIDIELVLNSGSGSEWMYLSKFVNPKHSIQINLAWL